MTKGSWQAVHTPVFDVDYSTHVDTDGDGSYDENYYTYTVSSETNYRWAFDDFNKYSGPAQSRGDGWETAALAFMAVDVAVPDPTDAAWPKWAGYAVVGTAAAVYLANNNNFFYETYTKTNAAGQVYVGRSSGYGDPYSEYEQGIRTII